MREIAAHVGALSTLGLPPERQFLYYAWPCLDNRAGHGQPVSEVHIGEIRALIRGRTRPRRSLLRYAFPDAYRGIGHAAEALGVNRWTQAAVERYFLVDHGMHLETAVARGVPDLIVDLCRVFIGEIASLDPLQCHLLFCGIGQRRALNPLALPFRLGSYVAVHGLTVVDVLAL